jgi:hypothetical protein
MPKFFAESIVPSSGGGSLAVSLTVKISIKIKNTRQISNKFFLPIVESSRLSKNKRVPNF